MALADRAGDDFMMLAAARPRQTRCTPPANGIRPSACSPTPSDGSRHFNPNIRCCIRCEAINIATCFCRGSPPRRRPGAATIEIARDAELGLSRYRARRRLTLGRAHFALALKAKRAELRPRSAIADARVSTAQLGTAVDGLRTSGKATISLAACSPAPRSAAPLATGTAQRETSTRSRRSPSRDRCGFIFAIARWNARGSRWRAAKPSRRSTASSSRARRRPSRPTPPPALGEEARKELDAARRLIAECGYRRRDEELAELDDVVAGRRRFADLPPRV